MTVLEMQDSFQGKLSKFDDIKGIQYTTTEISRFLTEAQNHLVNVFSERFEFDERVKKYLSKIIITNIPAKSSTTFYPNSVLYELPANVKMVVQEFTTDGVRIKPIRLNYYNLNRNNPHKQPNKDLIWRLDVNLGNSTVQHVLIHDGERTIPNNYYKIVYIKNPSDIDIVTNKNCELHVQVHEDIVNLAIERAVAEARARIELMRESLPPQTSNE